MAGMDDLPRQSMTRLDLARKSDPVTAAERSALSDPPKCPSCRGVRMKRKEIERNEIIDGGSVHWQCPVCELHHVRAFG